MPNSFLYKLVSIYQTLLLEKDMTQGQFLREVFLLLDWLPKQG